jgi:methylenetetrahydrofolate dehydrogenase (NADP+) / methenyltetrahydrofolate cyclohydrolase
MIISGKQVADQILSEIQEKIESFQGSLKPHLAVVLVGNHPASMSYISMKQKACRKVGIKTTLHRFEDSISQEELTKAIEGLNKNSEVHGILLQLPLPYHLSQEHFIELISPQKDVDGFHPLNLGRLLAGETNGFIPCTPLGIYELLARSHIPLNGAHVVILGRSRIVGMPLAVLLSQKLGANSTVTICHSATKEMESHTQKADILVAAMGRAQFVKADMIKKGAVVIDVGINRIDDPLIAKGYRLVGDVAFDEVSQKAKAITPVPGGVGPMTVALLMQNTWKAFSSLCQIKS